MEKVVDVGGEKLDMNSNWGKVGMNSGGVKAMEEFLWVEELVVNSGGEELAN